MTYLALNAIFLGALAILAIPVAKRIPWRAIGLSTAALLVITAIFDNLIIGLGVVAYDPSKISGMKLGLAPIEDFAYSLAAPLLISLSIEYMKVLRWKR